jgi:hypothetical protein
VFSHSQGQSLRLPATSGGPQSTDIVRPPPGLSGSCQLHKSMDSQIYVEAELSLGHEDEIRIARCSEIDHLFVSLARPPI